MISCFRELSKILLEKPSIKPMYTWESSEKTVDVSANMFDHPLPTFGESVYKPHNHTSSFTTTDDDDFYSCCDESLPKSKRFRTSTLKSEKEKTDIIKD